MLFKKIVGHLENRSLPGIERPGQDGPGEGLHYRHWRHLVGETEVPALQIPWVYPGEFRLRFQVPDPQMLRYGLARAKWEGGR